MDCYREFQCSHPCSLRSGGIFAVAESANEFSSARTNLLACLPYSTSTTHLESATTTLPSSFRHLFYFLLLAPSSTSRITPTIAIIVVVTIVYQSIHC
ncbi:hypothetical protein HOY80DRAFT_940315 [Tuber brumale]|nr:hypothetical protein HOY80DRAFT_940315 [Tuber brumale]